jgi:hypothetical protein
VNEWGSGGGPLGLPRPAWLVAPGLCFLPRFAPIRMLRRRTTPAFLAFQGPGSLGVRGSSPLSSTKFQKFQRRGRRCQRRTACLVLNPDFLKERAAALRSSGSPAARTSGKAGRERDERPNHIIAHLMPLCSRLPHRYCRTSVRASPGSAVEEHHVLVDGVAADVQPVAVATAPRATSV